MTETWKFWIVQKTVRGTIFWTIPGGEYVTVIEDTMVHRGASGDSQTWGPAEACRQFKLLDRNKHERVYLRIEYDSPAKQGFIDSTKTVIGDASECDVNYPPSGSVLPHVLPEDNFIFYYHPDHLGSTGYMTDRIGRVYEHLQYTPWGETWVEQRRGKDLFPKYQFTGKELDPETNLYYFGARYYDPQTSVWASTDPMVYKYIYGKPIGGVYRPINLNIYNYSNNNPIIFFDPDGLAPTNMKPAERARYMEYIVNVFREDWQSAIQEKDMSSNVAKHGLHCAGTTSYIYRQAYKYTKNETTNSSFLRKGNNKVKPNKVAEYNSILASDFLENKGNINFHKDSKGDPIQNLSDPRVEIGSVLVFERDVKTADPKQQFTGHTLTIIDFVLDEMGNQYLVAIEGHQTPDRKTNYKLLDPKINPDDLYYDLRFVGVGEIEPED